jgi:hypothetical protein
MSSPDYATFFNIDISVVRRELIEIKSERIKDDQRAGILVTIV